MSSWAPAKYKTMNFGAPGLLDTCLFQFLLPDLEVNGRQAAVVRVLSLRVVEQLDVFEHVMPRIIARWIGLPPDPFPLQQLEVALGHRIIMAIAAPAHTGFEIVLMEEGLPLPAGEL